MNGREVLLEVKAVIIMDKPMDSNVVPPVIIRAQNSSQMTTILHDERNVGNSAFVAYQPLLFGKYTLEHTEHT